MSIIIDLAKVVTGFDLADETEAYCAVIDQVCTNLKETGRLRSERQNAVVELSRIQTELGKVRARNIEVEGRKDRRSLRKGDGRMKNTYGTRLDAILHVVESVGSEELELLGFEHLVRVEEEPAPSEGDGWMVADKTDGFVVYVRGLEGAEELAAKMLEKVK